ncbi:MAG TPA: Mu transposase C-terminal domain-containing protein [Pseudonocardiaceae bacterium]
MQYYCDALKPWIARRERLGKFVLRRDPRDISRIWALDPDGTTYPAIMITSGGNRKPAKPDLDADTRARRRRISQACRSW